VSGAPSPRDLSHRGVLALAVPVMLSNASTPLIGVVDTAVVGQIPDPAHIGAVAIGALIFGFAFWTFSFLRMGTTGLTAQALGAGDRTEIAASLGRALLAALVLGAAVVAFQWPIAEIAFALLGASGEVERLARDYFDIRIWSAPATFANYALLGWFIGLGRTDVGLALQLVLNLTNIVLAVVLGLALGFGVKGVAAAGLLAEVVATTVGVLVAWRWVRRGGGHASWALVLDARRLRRVVAVNGDIMIRTLAMIGIVVWFVEGGAASGDAVLAANALLLNCISVAAFFLDGVAFAAESLVGRSIGAGRRDALVRSMRVTTLWAVIIAAGIAAALLVSGAAIIDVTTVDPATRAVAREHLLWAVSVPLVGVWAFQLDGIFIGATRTAEMRNAALATLALYLAVAWLLLPFGNHGLWAALAFSYLARAGTLAWFLPRLVRSVPA
jgi:MATE family multidrug resistance protein